jgi:hypothetical protein
MVQRPNNQNKNQEPTTEQLNQTAQNTPVGGVPGTGYQFNFSPEAITSNMASQYQNPNMPGQLLLNYGNNPLAQSQLAGLELGKLLTGQTLGQSGQQVQDLLNRQMGLLGADNPITGEMTGMRNAAVARTGANMAKAGVRGGAAQAAKEQTARGMDKQIASQAYQQYAKNLGDARRFVSGIQRQQLGPMYNAMNMEMASQIPEFQGNAGGGLLSGLFESLFG